MTQFDINKMTSYQRRNYKTYHGYMVGKKYFKGGKRAFGGGAEIY